MTMTTTSTTRRRFLATAVAILSISTLAISGLRAAVPDATAHTQLRRVV